MSSCAAAASAALLWLAAGPQGLPKARKEALEDMTYLLNDNVEVITAPPTPAT
jgi:hypothetical protein